MNNIYWKSANNLNLDSSFAVSIFQEIYIYNNTSVNIYYWFSFLQPQKESFDIIRSIKKGILLPFLKLGSNSRQKENP